MQKRANGRWRTGRCSDDGREHRGRAQRGRRGALEQGEGVAIRGAAGALCLCGKKGFAKR
ncbi:hypothetical protein AHAS_Ahas13G0297500 [Arachis hypogaea]